MANVMLALLKHLKLYDLSSFATAPASFCSAQSAITAC